MASYSSPSNPRCTYDVFLSFRGEDTRHNFTDHLYTNLVRRGIRTFRDDQLRKGEKIAPELLKAIEESRSSIVVFSKNYADSRWCLDELAKIMDCRREYRQIVLPIFYHVDPSDVRKQTGSFGEAFTNHKENWMNKVQRWREALTEASNISGWHIKEGYESEHIKKITTIIANSILNCKLLFVEDNLVGMDSHFKRLSLGLSTESNNVHMIGICGIGGIGKTTIAGYVYNQISWGFECSSFLEKVKEVYKNKGLLRLQNQLLNDILDGGNQKISNVRQGAYVIKNSLYFRKALIVFDDVDDMEQLEFLVGDHTWFGKGSRIIITTRDRHLLTMLKVDYLYEVEGLNYNEALKLFSQYAFRPNLPQEDFKNLLDCVIHYCQGLPLALKVLGSLLCGKTIREWESELHKLEKEPEVKIQNVLKISFDELDPTQKMVFLDIACFFEDEDKDFVSKILDGCKLYGEINIRVLWERCLITILDNRIHMHDLIQKMGWEIVREQHPDNPSKWSRLWNPDDIYCAFISEKGMKNVETISLDLSRSEEIWFTPKIFDLMKKVFAKMKKLRLLKFYYDCHEHKMPLNKDFEFPQNLRYLHREGHEYKMSLPKGFRFPPNIKYLHWEGLESLPSNFHGENLIAINLKSSNIKELLKGEKHLAELKFIDISDSQQLIKIPEFSRMPKLEKLNLEGCISFCKLHSSISTFSKMKFFTELNFSGSGIRELPSSIGSLISLETLNLSKCSKFENFPDTIFVNMGHLRRLQLSQSGIKELPSSIGYLESLELLSLSGCLNFEKFPEIQGNMKHLKRLSLRKTAIKELPTSIGCLESLEFLDLLGCLNLEKFPEIQGNMKHLNTLSLRMTAIKELPTSIWCLEALNSLDLLGCSNFEKFPEIQGNMKRLRSLCLGETAIKELPTSIECLEALEILSLHDCSKFEKFPEIQKNMKNLRDLYLQNSAVKELPCSINHLTRLRRLELSNCKNLSSLPSNICQLKFLKGCSLNGCSNLEIFPEIMEDMEHLEGLYLRELAIRELPSSIERLKGLRLLELSNCENLETLPNSIGNLTCLDTLLVHNCPKLHKLPDSLRGLQRCLRQLDVGGCNLMEGAIPSDLWCLFSLLLLNMSENNIHCIPVGIIQLSQLNTLRMNHCLMLEEIPELPSSLRRIEAHGCPCLETLSCDATHLLWSYLLNCFKSQIQGFGCQTYSSLDRSYLFRVCRETNVVIPGSSGIPEWISHKSMGSEIRIDLPKNWYEDNFLGFALFCHHVPLHDDDDDDICKTVYDDDDDFFDDGPQFVLSMSYSDGFEYVGRISFVTNCKTYFINGLSFRSDCYDKSISSSPNPALRVAYFPKIAISSKFRSSGWNNFEARFEGTFKCGDKAAFKVESCGIHLIYDDAQDHHQQSLQLFTVKRSRDDIEDHPHHKKSRHCLVSSSFHQDDGQNHMPYSFDFLTTFGDHGSVDYVEGSCDNVRGTEKNHPPMVQYVDSVVPGIQDDAPKHIPQLLDLPGNFGEHGSVAEDTNGDVHHKGHSTEQSSP